MIISYCPEKFVDVTLDKFKVPEDQRAAIKSELAEKDKGVVTMVEEKAATMDPNPLRDPSQREQAVKIFRETLYTLFSGVMTEHGVEDKEQIQAMLDDIQYQKAQFFTQCMEKYHPNIQVEEAPDEDNYEGATDIIDEGV